MLYDKRMITGRCAGKGSAYLPFELGHYRAPSEEGFDNSQERKSDFLLPSLLKGCEARFVCVLALVILAPISLPPSSTIEVRS